MFKDIITKLIVDPLSGSTFSAYIAVVLILGFSWLLIKGFVQIVKAWPEVYERYVITRSRIRKMAKEEADKYINERRDAEILEDENFKNKLREVIGKEMQVVLFEKMDKLYKSISQMRVEYAEKMATKEEIVASRKEFNEDVATLRKELNELARELSRLEGQLNK